MILLPARGFLTVEVEDHVIHLLADAGIVGQHLVTEACGGAIRKFLPHALEKGFGIGKLLRVAIGIGDAAHQGLVPRHVLPLDIQIIGRTVPVIIAQETGCSAGSSGNAPFPRCNRSSVSSRR